MAGPGNFGRETITRDIRRPTVQARLVGLSGPHAGQTHNLGGEPVLFGRDDEAEFSVNSPEVSRQHAVLLRTDAGAWILEDLSSSNGSFVNGLRVKGAAEIHFGDRIQLGSETLFIFTHQDMLEDQVLQLQKMEALGSLAGEVAHDFKNLLTVMYTTVGFLRVAHKEEELLTAGDLDDEGLTRHLDRMQEASERANDLCHRLLSFSRPGTGKHGPVDVASVVEEAVKLCQETFDEKLIIETKSSPGLTVPADASQVHQVVMNLLINARDAMPDGGTIRVAADRIPLLATLGMDVPFTPGEYVAISVADNGSGIDEATRARMFEPFFTTKPAGEGSGLGLATVYAIAARHGGHALVESAPGEGATLRVFFPTRVPGKPEALGRMPAHTADLPAIKFPENAVLLCLDDGAAAKELKERLDEAGMEEVIVVRSGAEAIRLYEQHRRGILLILLDKDLVDMDAVDAVRALQRINPEADVLVLANSLEETEAAEIRLAGALGVIPRDASADQLKEMMLRIDQ